MLSFQNVEFSFPNQPVFFDLNFDLNPGEFTFLIGKSGVGKSTLLQLIYMNLLPDSGVVRVGDYDSKSIKPRQIPLLRRKLGVIFQDFKLLQDRNVFQNLAEDEKTNHRVKVYSGIYAEESKRLLKLFFTDLRNQQPS